MIPIRDTLRARRTPFVNYALIAACTYVFWLEWSAGSEVEQLVEQHALVPARFVALAAKRGLFEPALFAPFVSSMFMHGSLAHFAGNMLFLWIFGDNVEDRLGHARYALFYLSGGLAAGAAHVIANPASVVPTIGASGAIAAVMGAYMLLFPGARILSAVVVVFIVRVISVPALVWLALWFLFQLLAGAAESAAPGSGGVAWWAHIGGFAFGMGVVLVFGLRGARRPLGVEA